MCCQTPCAKMDSLRGRGGRCITFELGGFAGQCQPGQAVRHEVDPQDLDRRQRNRQPEERREEDRPDLACVARHDKADELADVVVDATALAHGGDDRREVVVQQHQVRRLARNVGSATSHRDTDVSPAQRRRVVDAVARHRDAFAARLQRLDDADLLRRVDAGVDLNAWTRSGSAAISMRASSRACHRLARRHRPCRASARSQARWRGDHR